MYIWHHAKELPNHVRFRASYGLTLSLGDYIFKNNYVPYSAIDIKHGFEGDEHFPKEFLHQELYPLKTKG